MGRGSALAPLDVLLALLVGSAGCGSGNRSYALDVGGDDAGGLMLGPDDAGGTAAFDAHIEEKGATVTFVTLSCSGPCADVQAVATGGRPPYAYRWEDGSTNPIRHVCPTSTRSYSVTATDTGSQGEIATAAATAKATLTADVVACPDAGARGTVPDAGDGGTCISNPSFEGTPAGLAGILGQSFSAPPWVSCGGTAAVVNQTVSIPTLPALPDPANGNTYVSLNTGVGGGASASVSEPLCATMHAGTTYSVKVDLASPDDVDSGSMSLASLAIFGSDTSCTRTEPLWTSPPAATSWSTYCATFTPTRDTSYLTLTVTGDTGTGWTALYVDDFVPVAGCP